MLADRDARAMEHIMTTMKEITPKKAAVVINKSISEWTVRTALHRIGKTAAIKQKTSALSDENVAARLKSSKEHKHWSVEDWKKLFGQMRPK